MLWSLSDAVPLADLPIILDGIEAISREDDVERCNAWEVASFYTRSLIRVWKSDLPFEPARMLGWLRTRHSYADTYSGATDELRDAIAATPERLREIADSFLQGVEADDNRWVNWHELRELTFFQLDLMDLRWLSWAAYIYFGMFNDVDRSATPQERLVTVIVDANSKIALAGLEATLQRTDVSTFDEMMEGISARKTRQWWHCLVAGLNERWQRRTDYEGVPQDLLRALVAFNLVAATSS